MLWYKAKISLFQQTMKNSTLASRVVTHKDQQVSDFPNQEPEVEFNVMAAFATAHQRYLRIIITEFALQNPTCYEAHTCRDTSRTSTVNQTSNTI